jgi:hypothetical protein
MRVYFNASDAHPDLFSAVRRRYIFIVDRFEFLQDQFPDLYLKIIFQDIRHLFLPRCHGYPIFNRLKPMTALYLRVAKLFGRNNVCLFHNQMILYGFDLFHVLSVFFKLDAMLFFHVFDCIGIILLDELIGLGQ